MSKELVDGLKSTSEEGVYLFGQLVEAWEGVVDENTRELHLVTDAQAATWLQFRDGFTARLKRIGQDAIDTGSWDAEKLDSARRTLTGAQHKSASELAPAPVKQVMSSDVQQKTKRWFERLNRLGS